MRFTENLGLAVNCHTREIPSFRPGICEICWLCRPSLRMPRAHGELNQVDLLLRYFARELLKRCLPGRVEFVRMIELSRSE